MEEEKTPINKFNIEDIYKNNYRVFVPGCSSVDLDERLTAAYIDRLEAETRQFNNMDILKRLLTIEDKLKSKRIKV